ncbi:unnamed protein product [Blepharisma stoltei]|uniref:Uncharacterized protein n=1 Tax=Blepharisma stoltei TaxID=1481888 RepID=A0AAU9JNV4_9CILI|nr:unnamed protein product [Blepharisma stoltei]
MILLLLFSITSYAAADASYTCIGLQCGAGTWKQCMLNNSQTTLTLSPCLGNYTCTNAAALLASSTTTSFPNITCESTAIDNCGRGTWTPDLNPTGWSCCENSDCISGSCINNTCQGLTSGQECEYHGQCQPWYYCSGYCTLVSAEIGSNCDTDYECPPGCGCNLKKCTGLLSLDDGEKSENMKFCKSMLVQDGICDNIVIYSEAEQYLDYPFQCNMGSNCMYLYRMTKKFAYSKSCNCGGDRGNSTGFCWFDTPGVSSIDISQALVFNDTKCSGDPAHSIDPDILFACTSITGDNYNFYYHILHQRNYWPLYKSGFIDSCALKFGLFDTEDWMSHDNAMIIGLISMIYCLV